MAKISFFLLIILLALGFCQIGAEQKDVPQDLPSPPLITSVLPTSAYLDSPPFLLYVYGENFTGDSVILINKLVRPTTFISEKELRCSTEVDFDAIIDDTLPRLRGNFSRGGRTKKMTVVVRNPGFKSSNSMTIRLLDKGFINFTKPYPIITHPSSTYFFEDIETDNQGNIYIVYEYPFPGSDVDELYLVHSSNYGKTWESPINISNTPLFYSQSHDLVVDKDGNLLLGGRSM